MMGLPADWLWGLFGGLMIGSAAAAFLLLNGRIMGASGILGRLVDGSGRNDLIVPLAFIVGLVGFPGLALLVTGGVADTHATSNIAILIISGLMVGFGTRMGNGCTSGHGVCGISRLSIRGIGATLVYLGAGAAMMVVARHLLGWV